MDQEQEFEFRARAEQEQRARARAAALKPSTDLASPPAEAPVDHAANAAAMHSITSGGAINNLLGAVPEAATHYLSKMEAGAASIAGGGAGILSSLAGGPDPEFTKPHDMAAAVGGAVPISTPETTAGKALTKVGDWALGLAGKGIQKIGETAADATQGLSRLARHAGHPDIAGALDSASGVVGAAAEGTASVLAPAGAVKLLQTPFKNPLKRPMSAGEAAQQAKFDGSVPPQAGPPLRVDPTLDMSQANPQPPPRAGDLGIDMAGRTDPGINMSAAPDDLGNPLGSPSAAATPPLVDTRPNKSVLDRIIDAGNERAATATAMNATHTKNVQDALEFDWRITPKEQGAGHINQIAAGAAGNAKIGKANTEHNAQRATQAIKEDFGLEPGPLHDADLKPILAEAQGSREKIKAVDITIQSDKQMKRDVATIRGDFAKAAKEFPDLIKDDKIDQLVASLSQQTEFVPGKASTWGGPVSKRNSPATEPIPAEDMAHTPGALMELSRNLRAKAADDLKSIAPADRAIGLARRKAAQAVEGLLDRKLSEAGYADLVAEHAADRTKMAKVYDTLGALDNATGQINPHTLGQMWEADKPMSGVLERVGRLSRAFKDSARNLDSMKDTSHYGALDVTVVRPLAREWYQTAMSQRMIGAPDYSPGATVNLAQAIRDKADPLMFGAAGAAAQRNFDMNNPLGFPNP